MILVSPIVLIISIMWGYVTFYAHNTFYMSNLNVVQKELHFENDENLINKKGSLKHAGWARNTHKFNFNIDDTSYSYSLNSFIHKLRFKKWETLTFTSNKYIIMLQLYDLKYSGGYSINIVNIAHSKNVTQKEDNNFDFNDDYKKDYYSLIYKPQINETCKINCEQSHYINNKDDKNFFNYSYNKTTSNNHKFSFDFRDNNISIKMKISLVYKDYADSIVSISPINMKKNYFVVSSKTNLMVPKGIMILNGIKLNGEDFLVTYNSNKGVFPVKNKMVWANGNGYLNNGKKIGLNFGYGLQHFNKSMHTEDCFFIEGKLFKLNAVFSEPSYSKSTEATETTKSSNVSKSSKSNIEEWSFYNYDNDYTDKGTNYCDVIFISVSNSIDHYNILMNNVRFEKYFGYFKGMCKDGNGNEYTFDRVYGVIEDNEYVW